VRLYRIDGWQELARLPDSQGIDRLLFSPDGRYLAGFTSMGMRVPLWACRAANCSTTRNLLPG
jgi:hypothetical protein